MLDPSLELQLFYTILPDDDDEWTQAAQDLFSFSLNITRLFVI